MVAGRGGDDRQPRRQVPERDRRRPARPSSSTRRRASSSSGVVSSDARRRARRRHTAAEGGGTQAEAGASAAGATARRPTSPTPSSGSTRRRQAALDRRLHGEGHVVLIDFWTYTCINCIRTLPYVEAWYSRVPPRRARRRRRPLARVPVREGRRQRRRRDRAERHHLPGRPGQRLRHLERVRQPVLAGQVPDRRATGRSATSTSARATTTQTEAAIRSLLAEAGAGRLGGRAAAERASAPTRRCATPETYLGAARAAAVRQRPARPAARTTGRYAARARCRRTSSPTAARWDDRRRGGDRRDGASARARLPARGASSWSSARPGSRARCRCCSTASRSRPADAGDDVHGGVGDGHAPAPLPAGRPARGSGTTSLDAALRARDRGLRVHLRLVRAWRALRARGCRRARAAGAARAPPRRPAAAPGSCGRRSGARRIGTASGSAVASSVRRSQP